MLPYFMTCLTDVIKVEHVKAQDNNDFNDKLVNINVNISGGKLYL
jgi:hypothetical protein